MYTDCKVYGPYRAKDGRFRILVRFANGRKTTVSYPKYLVEKSIGRLLESHEVVHHVDGNATNNDISNLVVMTRAEHTRVHNPTKNIDSIVECFWCQKHFQMTAEHQRNRRAMRSANKSGPFCSRKCSGLYGKSIQEATRQRSS